MQRLDTIWKRLIAPIAIWTIAALVGCGGGNTDTGATATKAAGIWSGTATSSAGTSNMDVEFVQNGTVLDGMARFVKGGTVNSGGLSGSISGNSISVAVAFSGSNTPDTFGTSTVNLTQVGNTISGTFVRTYNDVVLETGAIHLTKSSVSSSPNLTGSYSLNVTNASGITSPLAITISQPPLMGDGFNIQSGTVLTGLAGSGVIIGNTLTAWATWTASTSPLSINVVYLSGTVTGSSISGTTVEPASNSGVGGVQQNGTFTLRQ